MSLKFEEKPNYEFIIQYLNLFLLTEDPDFDYKFDWEMWDQVRIFNLIIFRSLKLTKGKNKQRTKE